MQNPHNKNKRLSRLVLIFPSVDKGFHEVVTRFKILERVYNRS